MAALVTDDIAAFAAACGETGRLLGLDLGTKTVGLALSDPARMIASPLTTLKRDKFSIVAAELARIVADNSVSGLVLGLPKNLDNSNGPRVQATRAFARNLSAGMTAPILFWDERLTTVEAERLLLEADTSRRRRAQVIDKMAAALILQGALERLAHYRHSVGTQAETR